ncbi:MAG: hypothetical protein BWY76_00022 [bacterium ADurb.Bin429]|nr:MAG: hypothetical protein BWY76_00022 [bacterium ADurb.Bin429]
MDETEKRPWRWIHRALITLGALLVVFATVSFISTRLYQGPQTLDRAQQRAMAIPLWLLKRQGATRAETAFLFVAADPAFIREWYLRELTNDGWTLITATPRRILFVKERSAVQITIGPQRDLLTPYQLVYLNGLTKRQLTDLRK